MKIGDNMGNKRKIWEAIISNRFKKILIFLLTYITLFAIASMSIIPKKYSLKEGDIAPVDIKSPRDFEDEEATLERINKVISQVSPRYNKDINVQKEALKRLDDFVETIKNYNKEQVDNQNEQIEKIKSDYKYNLTTEDIKYLINLNDEELNKFNEFLSNTLSKILAQDIRENYLEDLKKAQQDLDFYVKSSNLSKNLKDIANTIGIASIKPNMFYDHEKTEELRQQAKKGIEPVIIKKNQNIILKGEVVTAHHVYLISKAGMLEENRKYDLIIYAGVGLIVLTAMLLLILFINQNKKHFTENIINDIIIAILFILMAVLTVATKVISVYLIPSSFLAILVTLIYGYNIGLVASILNSLIIMCITNFNIEILIMYIVSSMMAVYFTSRVNERNNILLGGVFIGLINFLVVYSVNILTNTIYSQAVYNSFLVLLNGILSAILAIGFLPVFEQVFNILTPVKLLELSNPNQVLLKKLLFEAPGTYHHSILVGNLSEAAANEIGANALLARVGAYYHDIGKTKRPYFFKENQITNDNPHNKVTPKLSVSIITAHVQDGLELAVKHKLPKAIQDIIVQHHGTTLVKYFYVQALNDGEEEINEMEFRYPGPKPNTKESAIIMLADSVEAAVRAMNNPTVEDIKSMVDKIIKDKMLDGQLNDSPITFSDIEKIKQAFEKVLLGIFHTRIEYPDLDKKEEENQ